MGDNTYPLQHNPPYPTSPAHPAQGSALYQEQSTLPPHYGQDNVYPLHSAGFPPAPPPYSATAPSLFSQPVTVKCEMCHAVLDVTGSPECIINCGFCSKPTAIKPPPDGMKYVRCTACDELNVTQSYANSITCVRPTCRQVLHLGPVPIPAVVPGLLTLHLRKFQCAYCSVEFSVTTTRGVYAKCPHCGKANCINPKAKKYRGIAFILIGIVFLAVAIGVTVGTYEDAEENGGIYVVYVGGFVIAAMMFLQAIVVFTCWRTGKLLD